MSENIKDYAGAGFDIQHAMLDCAKVRGAKKVKR
jgi:hypothetical protein